MDMDEAIVAEIALRNRCNSSCSSGGESWSVVGGDDDIDDLKSTSSVSDVEFLEGVVEMDALDDMQIQEEKDAREPKHSMTTALETTVVDVDRGDENVCGDRPQHDSPPLEHTFTFLKRPGQRIRFSSKTQERFFERDCVDEEEEKQDESLFLQQQLPQTPIVEDEGSQYVEQEISSNDKVEEVNPDEEVLAKNVAFSKPDVADADEAALISIITFAFEQSEKFTSECNTKVDGEEEETKDGAATSQPQKHLPLQMQQLPPLKSVVIDIGDAELFAMDAVAEEERRNIDDHIDSMSVHDQVKRSLSISSSDRTTFVCSSLNEEEEDTGSCWSEIGSNGLSISPSANEMEAEADIEDDDDEEQLSSFASSCASDLLVIGFPKQQKKIAKAGSDSLIEVVQNFPPTVGEEDASQTLKSVVNETADLLVVDTIVKPMDEKMLEMTTNLANEYEFASHEPSVFNVGCLFDRAQTALLGLYCNKVDNLYDFIVKMFLAFGIGFLIGIFSLYIILGHTTNRSMSDHDTTLQPFPLNTQQQQYSPSDSAPVRSLIPPPLLSSVPTSSPFPPLPLTPDCFKMPSTQSLSAEHVISFSPSSMASTSEDSSAAKSEPIVEPQLNLATEKAHFEGDINNLQNYEYAREVVIVNNFPSLLSLQQRKSGDVKEINADLSPQSSFAYKSEIGDEAVGANAFVHSDQQNVKIPLLTGRHHRDISSPRVVHLASAEKREQSLALLNELEHCQNTVRELSVVAKTREEWCEHRLTENAVTISQLRDSLVRFRAASRQQQQTMTKIGAKTRILSFDEKQEAAFAVAFENDSQEDDGLQRHRRLDSSHAKEQQSFSHSQQQTNSDEGKEEEHVLLFEWSAVDGWRSAIDDKDGAFAHGPPQKVEPKPSASPKQDITQEEQMSGDVFPLISSPNTVAFNEKPKARKPAENAGETHEEKGTSEIAKYYNPLHQILGVFECSGESAASCGGAPSQIIQRVDEHLPEEWERVFPSLSHISKQIEFRRFGESFHDKFMRAPIIGRENASIIADEGFVAEKFIKPHSLTNNNSSSSFLSVAVRTDFDDGALFKQFFFPSGYSEDKKATFVKHLSNNSTLENKTNTMEKPVIERHQWASESVRRYLEKKEKSRQNLHNLLSRQASAAAATVAMSELHEAGNVSVEASTIITSESPLLLDEGYGSKVDEEEFQVTSYSAAENISLIKHSFTIHTDISNSTKSDIAQKVERYISTSTSPVDCHHFDVDSTSFPCWWFSRAKTRARLRRRDALSSLRRSSGNHSQSDQEKGNNDDSAAWLFRRQSHRQAMRKRSAMAVAENVKRQRTDGGERRFCGKKTNKHVKNRTKLKSEVPEKKCGRSPTRASSTSQNSKKWQEAPRQAPPRGSVPKAVPTTNSKKERVVNREDIRTQQRRKDDEKAKKFFAAREEKEFEEKRWRPSHVDDVDADDEFVWDWTASLDFLPPFQQLLFDDNDEHEHAMPIGNFFEDVEW